MLVDKIGAEIMKQEVVDLDLMDHEVEINILQLCLFIVNLIPELERLIELVNFQQKLSVLLESQYSVLEQMPARKWDGESPQARGQ